MASAAAAAASAAATPTSSPNICGSGESAAIISPTKAVSGCERLLKAFLDQQVELGSCSILHR